MAPRNRFSPRKEVQSALAVAAGEAMLLQQSICDAARALAQARWESAVNPFVALIEFKRPAARRKRTENAAKLEEAQAYLRGIVGDRVYKYWRTR